MNYPERPAERDAWVLARRGPRNPVSPAAAHARFVEMERAETGELVSVGTLLLTNRECPWRCVMCDLWRNSREETVPAGAIPGQIRQALDAWKAEGAFPRQVKLYNSGSFFDPRAIPPADHPEIARLVAGFDRVIVECHPSLISERAVRFRDDVGKPLEIAIGLETAHPETLAKLNKRMTVEQFGRAAGFLRAHGLALRVFLLVHPPFLNPADAPGWTRRSVELAFECGATAVTLIPTRAGNGALDELASAGLFTPPTLDELESAMDAALPAARGRLFADLWDLDRFSQCAECLPARRARLESINREQHPLSRIKCRRCATP